MVQSSADNGAGRVSRHCSMHMMETVGVVVTSFAISSFIVKLFIYLTAKSISIQLDSLYEMYGITGHNKHNPTLSKVKLEDTIILSWVTF